MVSSAGKAIGAKEIDGRALAEAMAEAAQAVRNRAKASPGDKTMVDALLPAVEALRAAADEGPDAALLKAAAAAAAGAEATRQMIRAWESKDNGERGVGFVDPVRSRSPSSSRACGDAVGRLETGEALLLYVSRRVRQSPKRLIR